MVGLIEEVDGERRVRWPFARTAARWRDRMLRGGLETQKGLGGSGAPEALVGPETDIVEQGQLEPSLQVHKREGTVEAEPRRILQRSPEAFQPGRGVEILVGREALE